MSTEILTYINGFSSFDEVKAYIKTIRHPHLYGVYSINKDGQSLFSVIPLSALNAIFAFDEAAACSTSARKWVGLTDEEIDRVTDLQWAANNNKPVYAAHRAYARAIEAKLKEKNA